jgi:hypothetical protein
MRVLAALLVFVASSMVIGACVEESDDEGDGGEAGNSSESTGGRGLGGIENSGGDTGVAGSSGGEPSASEGGAGAFGGSVGGGGGVAGGTDGEPPDEPAAGGETGSPAQPAECRLVEKTTETSRCVGKYTCGERSIQVVCNENGAGRSCSCNRIALPSAQINGASGYESCEIMLEACANPEQRGNEECAYPDFEDALICNSQISCARTVPTSGGGVATLMRGIEVNCGLVSTATAIPHRCYCEDRPYEIDEFSPEQCRAVVDGCVDRELGLDGPSDCHPTKEVQPDDDTRCEFGFECTTPIGANGSVRRVHHERRALCRENATGQVACWCSYDEAGAQFETDQSTTSGACERFAMSCTDAAEVAFDGPIECRTTIERVGSDCGFEGICTRSGAMGDVTIFGAAPLSATCSPTSEGVWDCVCRSDVAPSSPIDLTLEAADADSACRAAFLDQCPSALDFRFGETATF